ncbi:MAG: hypothetical protein ACOYK9_01555 [Chlamydiia bacterium]
MDFAVEDLPRVYGSDFLEVEWTIPFCKNLKEVEANRGSQLPSMEPYTLQEEFVDVYMGISSKDFFAVFDVACPLQKTQYPEFKKGDAIELIIDTNPSKSQGVTTRFVHHFVFLPTPYEGIFAKEITRFRGSDTRTLIPDEELKLTVQQSKNSYKASITIALNSFKGFDESTRRIGIGYRVHRNKSSVQEFPLNSQSMHFDVHPGLLAMGILGAK